MTRNIFSHVTDSEMRLVNTIWEAMRIANGADVPAHTDADARYHSAQAPFYAYGDLYVALRHLVAKLWGDDGELVYQALIDCGENTAYCIDLVQADRRSESEAHVDDDGIHGIVVDMRVQTHPATDAWAQGLRYGVVKCVTPRAITVELDNAPPALAWQAFEPWQVSPVE